MLYSTSAVHLTPIFCCPQSHDRIHYDFFGSEEQLVFLLDETNQDSAI